MPTVTARDAEATGRARAWGWVAHLQSGGTTPWSAWRERADGDAAASGPWLPGAQQLELLRRLNQAGRPDQQLVCRVLTAAATGRGRHDVGLAGAGPPDHFGPDPVDPVELADEELLRVAVGLLAEELASPDSSAVSPGKRTAATQTNRRVAPRFRTRYRLAGDPGLCRSRRAALVADGRPPGGQGAAVLVLGTDLATMLGHAWVAGALAEGGPSWPDFLTRWRRRDGVPRRVDLPAIADRWRADPAVGRVDVVLDLDAVPRLLRLRGASTRSALATDPVISAAAADLARRTATALGLLVPAEQRPALLDSGLRPRLELFPGQPPTVPVEHRGWIEQRATWMRDRLLRSGPPVMGDAAALIPRWDQHDPGLSAGSAPAAGALDVAVVLLLGGPS